MVVKRAPSIQQLQILNIVTSIDELKKAVIGHNGDIPGLVSDMRNVCTRLEILETKVDELSISGCKIAQVIHNPPHAKDRAEDKISYKYAFDKLIGAVINWTPWALMIAVLIKYFTVKP